MRLLNHTYILLTSRWLHVYFTVSPCYYISAPFYTQYWSTTCHLFCSIFVPLFWTLYFCLYHHTRSLTLDDLFRAISRVLVLGFNWYIDFTKQKDIFGTVCRCYGLFLFSVFLRITYADTVGLLLFFFRIISCLGTWLHKVCLMHYWFLWELISRWNYLVIVALLWSKDKNSSMSPFFWWTAESFSLASKSHNETIIVFIAKCANESWAQQVTFCVIVWVQMIY